MHQNSWHFATSDGGIPRILVRLRLRLLFGQSIGGIDYSNDYLLLNHPNSKFVQHAYMPLLGFYTINENQNAFHFTTHIIDLTACNIVV